MKNNTSPLFATLILTFGVLFHVQAQDPLTNRLVAYYPFNGNGNDQSGNGNHSTPAGNYAFVTNGLSGGALQIIGDNSIYYSGGGHALLPTFSSSMNTGFTFSAWVKIGLIGGNPFQQGTIITFGALSSPLAEIHLNKYTATPYLLYLMNSGGPAGPNVEFRQNVDSQTLATSWTHVVMAYAPGKIAAYLNGQKVGETNYTFDVFPVSTAAIGRHWWDSGASSAARMDAVIDNVRIYNRALASSEVQALYVFEKNPLPYLTIAVKTVRVDAYVEIGKTYQLQSSSNLNTWNPVGIPFVAAASKYSSDFDVLDGQQFFRIIEIVP